MVLGRSRGGRATGACRYVKEQPDTGYCPILLWDLQGLFEGFSRTSREWLAGESDGRKMEAEKWELAI
jgi:hypothetical protein